MRRIVFSDLRWGDKIAYFSEKGEITTYVYLGRDPSFSRYSCYMVNILEGNAYRFADDTLENENFYLWNDINEVYDESDRIKKNYYKEWLRKHTSLTIFDSVESNIPVDMLNDFLKDILNKN